MIDWLFRDRRTGRIVIAQFPNLPLWIFVGASALRWLLDPTGSLRTGLEVLATAGLVWWAADEVLRGVNPWRRFLGAAVLVLQVAGLVAGS